MDSRFQKYFLKKADLDRWDMEVESTENIRRVVVIPALAESRTLFTLLNDLGAAPRKILEGTLVVCVINNRAPEHCESNDIRDNQRTLELLRDWNPPGFSLGVVDASSPGKELSRNEGVGSARKIGLDLGARVLWVNGCPQAPLISIDADCRVSKGFLPTISSFFEAAKRWAAITEYAHPVGEDSGYGNLRGILAYETFLRYHELGLRYAGSPYAFHTIGSTIVCTAEAYVTCGGMRKRNAAEDFYFLQELAKTGRVEFITDTCVVPSSRVSHRVPFGTGRSMDAFLQDETEGYTTHSPEVFDILKAWLDKIAENPDGTAEDLLARADSISSDLAGFLKERGFGKAWSRIRRQARSTDQRLRAFHRWFDAFQTLKCIHHLRDHQFGRTSLFPSLETLLLKMGIAPPTSMGDISRDETDQQRDLLLFLREAMREMKR